MVFTVFLADCSFPLEFRCKPCLVKCSVSKFTCIRDALSKTFKGFLNFLLNTFISLCTQEFISRSYFVSIGYALNNNISLIMILNRVLYLMRPFLTFIFSHILCASPHYHNIIFCQFFNIFF